MFVPSCLFVSLLVLGVVVRLFEMSLFHSSSRKRSERLYPAVSFVAPFHSSFSFSFFVLFFLTPLVAWEPSKNTLVGFFPTLFGFFLFFFAMEDQSMRRWECVCFVDCDCASLVASVIRRLRLCFVGDHCASLLTTGGEAGCFACPVWCASGYFFLCGGIGRGRVRPFMFILRA